MIDPVTLTVTCLVVSAGVRKYVETRRTEERRKQSGYTGAVKTVHLADVEDLLDGLDEQARESLIYSEALGAYLVDGRPLPPEYKQ